jgi:hypothetical protein
MMTQNTIETEAMQGDGLNQDFLSVVTYSANITPSNNAFPIYDPTTMSSNSNSLSHVTLTTIQQPQQQLTAPVVPQLPTFATTVVPVTPAAPNAIQPPALVQQTSASQQQILNQNVQQPIAIPSMSIPSQQTEAIQQNLFVQQQHQHIQQYQQQIQVQQQLLQQQFHYQQQQQQQQQYQQQHVFSAVTIPQQMPAASQPIIHNLIPEVLEPSLLATTTSFATPALIMSNNNYNYTNAVNMVFLAAAFSANNPTALATTATTAQQMSPLLIPQQIKILQQQQQPPIVSIPLTVQDRPSIIPSIFNGVNLAYPGIEPLGVDPPLLLVRDFLTHAECDFLVRAAEGVWQPAPVVGKGTGEISPSRTSSTCFLAREDLPDYMRKVSALTSKPIDHCELPQVGRYLPSQQYRHVRSN